LLEETPKVSGANRFIRNALWSLEESKDKLFTDIISNLSFPEQKQQKRKGSEYEHSSSKKSKLDE